MAPWRSICACRRRWAATAAAPTLSSCSPVGYASCFESALKVMARRQRVESGDATIDSKVHLHPTQAGGFELSVELDISLPSIDDADAAVELVKAAHQVCPYSNATRGNIEVQAHGERPGRRLSSAAPRGAQQLHVAARVGALGGVAVLGGDDQRHAARCAEGLALGGS